MSEISVDASSIGLGEIKTNTTYNQVIQAAKFNRETAEAMAENQHTMMEVAKDADAVDKLEDNPVDRAKLAKYEAKYKTAGMNDLMGFNERKTYLGQAMFLKQRIATSDQVIKPSQTAIDYITQVAKLTKKKAKSLAEQSPDDIIAVAQQLANGVLGIDTDNADEEQDKKSNA